MDKIFIHGIELEAVIGAYPHERSKKQALLLDVELGVDISLATVSDSLTKTIDYDYLAEQITTRTINTEFLLIETLAEHIAQFILQTFPVHWLRLCLSKPGAVINAAKVGVIIERNPS